MFYDYYLFIYKLKYLGLNICKCTAIWICERLKNSYKQKTENNNKNRTRIRKYSVFQQSYFIFYLII